MGQGLPALREEHPKTDPGEATSDLEVLPVLSQRQRTGDLHQVDRYMAQTACVTLEGDYVSAHEVLACQAHVQCRGTDLELKSQSQSITPEMVEV